jgi:hypothetical protein
MWFGSAELLLLTFGNGSTILFAAVRYTLWREVFHERMDNDDL